MKLPLGVVAALTVAGLSSGCALVQPVEPWEMDTLARAEMALEIDPLLSSYRRHVQFSKEAATGTASSAGGGCGCN